MSRPTAHARASSNRASLYDEITDKIISELEAGRVPWVQPWGTVAAKAPLAMPRNAATGRQYSGHVNLGDSYWYMQAVPELMALAGDRFALHFGEARHV